MLEKGNQFIQIGRKIFHYSNWAHNRYLAPSERKLLLDIRTQDPRRADIVSIGVPAPLDASIYSMYVPHIKEINKDTKDWLIKNSYK